MAFFARFSALAHMCTCENNGEMAKGLLILFVVVLANFALLLSFMTPIKPKEYTNILILSSARSGSTMFGKLFSFPVNAMYLYEPLRHFKMRFGFNFNAFSIWEPMEIRRARSLMNSFFDCTHAIQPQASLNAGKKHINIEEDQCLANNLHVVKTIRLHAYNMIPWIFENPNIKIIQLIRDPRGIVNSLMNRPGKWYDSSLKDIEQMCNFMDIDSMILSLLQEPNRYVQVKYEDFMEKPAETLERIQKGLKIPKILHDFYVNRLKAENDSKIDFFSYWGVIRPRDFNYNHWKNELNMYDIKYIERACAKFMHNHGYEKFDEYTKINVL